MSGFLFTVVDYINDPNPTPSSTGNLSTTPMPNTTLGGTAHGFDTYWTPEYVPLYLIAILFPLVNFKSLTFFTKFNSLGARTLQGWHSPGSHGLGLGC